MDAVGDNLLAEFDSAVDAVQCAVEVQKGLRDKNQELPEDKKMEFRIGINIADVIEDGDRIFGTGVNVAARIESLADAGGICVSRSTYDQIKKKLKDIFAMRDEITMKIAAALQVKLTEGESANWGPETESFEAYIKLMQSLEHFKAFTPDDNILSRQKAKEALDLDPNYSSATEMFAWTLLMDGFLAQVKHLKNPSNRPLNWRRKFLSGETAMLAHIS